MLTQINKFNSFIAHVSTSSGRGPCFLTHDQADRNTSICVAKAYIVEFSNKHAWQEATEKNINPQIFVPASDVRHRPLKTETSIEGKFVNKKKLKKGRVNVYETKHVGLGRQLEEAEAVTAKEVVFIDCSPLCGQELLEKNFPEVVLLSTVGVRKCWSCKGRNFKNEVLTPEDLVFCMQVLQIWRDPKTKEWHKHYGIVYFHWTMSCVQKHNKDMTIEDVTMAIDPFICWHPNTNASFAKKDC